MLGKGCEKNTVKKEEVGEKVEERNQDAEYLIFLGDQNGVSWDSVIFTVSHIQHKALRRYHLWKVRDQYVLLVWLCC